MHQILTGEGNNEIETKKVAFFLFFFLFWASRQNMKGVSRQLRILRLIGQVINQFSTLERHSKYTLYIHIYSRE
jgi:hypothetical protein